MNFVQGQRADCFKYYILGLLFQHSQYPSSATNFTMIGFTLHLSPSALAHGLCRSSHSVHTGQNNSAPPYLAISLSSLGFSSWSICRLLENWHGMLFFFPPTSIHSWQRKLPYQWPTTSFSKCLLNTLKINSWYWINISKRSKNAQFPGDPVSVHQHLLHETHQ